MTSDQIDALTIAEVRAIAERASAALKTLQDLGLASSAPGVVSRRQSSAAELLPAQPFPCRHCGRTGPIQPNEPGGAECIACGNPLPLTNGQRLSNKGPIGLSADERARKLELPAFDKNGEPIS